MAKASSHKWNQKKNTKKTGGNALHSDGEGIAEVLDVRLVFVVAHAQQHVGLQCAANILKSQRPSTLPA